MQLSGFAHDVMTTTEPELEVPPDDIPDSAETFDPSGTMLLANVAKQNVCGPSLRVWLSLHQTFVRCCHILPTSWFPLLPTPHPTRHQRKSPLMTVPRTVLFIWLSPTSCHLLITILCDTHSSIAVQLVALVGLLMYVLLN